MLKAGARDADRAAGPDLFSIYSEFESMLVQLICFSENKYNVYETCPGSANPDTNRDLTGHNGFKKQPPLKHNSSFPPFSRFNSCMWWSVVATH